MKFVGCIFLSFSFLGVSEFGRFGLGHSRSRVFCTMSRPQWHRHVSHRNLTQLGGTIRRVLASNSNDEAIRVHGWVKSVRVQKRIAFAMIHDGTTQKGLQVVFRNPIDAKVSVCSPCTLEYRRISLHKLDKWCKCFPHRGPHPKSGARSE